MTRSSLTAKRIEAQYRFWLWVVWVYRAIIITFAAMVVFGIVLGSLPTLDFLYLAVAAIWWSLSWFWLSSAKAERKSQYALLEIYTDMEKRLEKIRNRG